jgi:precorrin-6B methylase 2
MKKMAWVPKKSNQNQDKSVVQASHANGVVKANKRLSHSMVNRKGVSVNTVVTGRAPQATGSKGTKFTGPDVIFVHGNEKIPVNGQLSFRGGEKLIKRVYQVKHNRGRLEIYNHVN